MHLNRNLVKRFCACLLIAALSLTVLASCSVTDDNPTVIRVGKVKVTFSQYASMLNQYAETYSSLYDFSKNSDLVKYQDLIFAKMVDYAVLLNKALEANLIDELTQEDWIEIEAAVTEEMDALTENQVANVETDELTLAQLNEKGFSFDEAADAETLKTNLDVAIESEYTGYYDKIEDKTLEGDAKDEAAKELLLADKGLTYEQFVAEETEQCKLAIVREKYADSEAVKLRDEYIEENYDMSAKKYENAVRDTSVENKLVTKMEEKLNDDETLVTDATVTEWYNEQVKTLTEEYAKDTSAFATAQGEYDSREEESTVVRPIVVPDGYVRVLHILLQNPEEIEDLRLPAKVQETDDAKVELTVPKERIAEVQLAINSIDRTLPAEEQIAAFTELIGAYNQDPGMMDEATLKAGYLVSEDTASKYTEGFASAALEIVKDGEGAITGAVETEYGIHFIQILEVIEPSTAELTDELKAEIMASLLEERGAINAERTLLSWVSEMHITEYKQRVRGYSGNTSYYINN